METSSLIDIGIFSILSGVFVFFDTKYKIIKTIHHVLMVFSSLTLLHILFSYFGIWKYIESFSQENEIYGDVFFLTIIIGITLYLVYMTFSKK